ncbi:unnamed protein product [Dovyalis caffra]|uniref:7-dehydrocholesterol reductase n=1 Tax=Dovyalis caffra TaxID=77055 RepID=A0AAV1QSV0_9ROSI|nr:unnamed protein product [Dovyalis caffra]
MIACFVAFEAALQLHLPGKRVEGPISPEGNQPVYKANGLAAYIVTLVTYASLWWFGIFNPAVVYDHLGETFSALILGRFVFLFFLIRKNTAAGIYLCWGFLVWLPCVYTSPGMYLVNHPVNLGIQIVASYTTTSGETKTSLLLASGCFYPISLLHFKVILLFDRAKRSDDRCRSKYGKYWKSGSCIARRFPTSLFLESAETLRALYIPYL